MQLAKPDPTHFLIPQDYLSTVLNSAETKMRTRSVLNIAGRIVAALVTLFMVAACAAQPQVVDHTFSYSTLRDDQDGEVLDYRYGDSNLPVRAPEWRVKQGNVSQGTNVTGRMKRGDFLYVKWRNKGTGKIYEDTVDLRNRLPADIEGHRVHFMIRGSQLYVYLISPHDRPPSIPPDGPSMYSDRLVKRIYPD